VLGVPISISPPLGNSLGYLSFYEKDSFTGDRTNFDYSMAPTATILELLISFGSLIFIACSIKLIK
jgi:hypothetical protein